jgi:HlyD family secretion protein
MKKINTDKSIRSTQILGFGSLAAMLGVFGAWTAFASLNGAVIAPATIVAESYSKKVQHREGGNVLRILIKDGDTVTEGQELVLLDPTEIKSELGIVQNQLNELYIKKARLTAQRDGAETFDLPSDLKAFANDPSVTEILNGQRHLLESTLQTVTSKKDQLKQQLGQIKDQIGGVVSQINSDKKQLALISSELASLRSLQKQGLVPVSRVSSMEREAARLDGEQGQLVASKASAEAKMSETKLQIIQVDEDLRNMSLTDLRDVDSKIGELEQRRVSAAARLSRMAIKAPIAGTIYQLAVHTEGGVVAPSETLMMIVPKGDDLVLQAQVTPNDIDHVHMGQAARVKFNAFNSRTMMDINAEVTQVAADTTRVDAQSAPFYLIRLTISADELLKLGDNKLKPGMSAEAFIETEARTPFSYLVQPLMDQFSHAMRES